MRVSNLLSSRCCWWIRFLPWTWNNGGYCEGTPRLLRIYYYGWGNKFYCSVGSLQAVPARPSGKGWLETRQGIGKLSRVTVGCMWQRGVSWAFGAELGVWRPELVGLCFGEGYQVEIWQCSLGKHAVERRIWVWCKLSKACGSVPPPLRTEGHGQSHCASLEWVIRFVVAVRRHDICVDKLEWEGRAESYCTGPLFRTQRWKHHTLPLTDGRHFINTCTQTNKQTHCLLATT